MTVLADNVTELLKRERKQQDLADRLGMDQSSVSRIAKGAQPKPENLIALARDAGVTVEMLVETPIADWPRLDRDEVQRRRKAFGWSPAILAQETHAIIRRERGAATVTAAAVEDFEAGRDTANPAWLRFARMAFEEGGAPKHQDTAPRDDLAYVRQVDIRYAMGAGTSIEDFPETALFPFNRKFLRSITSAPVEKLILATGQGDSMEPTVKEHDMILLDASENKLGLADTIWAFDYAGAGFLKRLRPIMQQGRRMVEVVSDNKEVAAPFVADPAEIHIVGKLAALIRLKP